jgi:prephenate dehydratase
VSFSGHRPRVAFQGEHGAFSEEAAFKLLGPDIELVPRRTFAEVFRSMEEDALDYAVVPIENTLIGPIQAAVNLLQSAHLNTRSEVLIQIEQHLIGCPGATLQEIETVESHPAALAQCKRFFAEHPRIVKVEAEDTAGSVARIIEFGDRKRAAIAGRRAAEMYGGVILKENLEDTSENYTRFLLLQSN